MIDYGKPPEAVKGYLDTLFGSDRERLARINAVPAPLGRVSAAVLPKDAYEWKGPFQIKAASIRQEDGDEILTVFSAETDANGFFKPGELPIVLQALVGYQINNRDGLLPEELVSAERSQELDLMKDALWKLSCSGGAYDAISHDGQARASLLDIALKNSGQLEAAPLNKMLSIGR